METALKESLFKQCFGDLPQEQQDKLKPILKRIDDIMGF